MGLNGNFPGAARVHDITVEICDHAPTVIVAAEERPRRNLLRLLAGTCSLTSGRLVYRGEDCEIDLAETSARELAAVRTHEIACSTTMPSSHPTLTCAQAVAALAHCTPEQARAELTALGHGHAVDQKVGDVRGADRGVLPIAATLLHPARILMLDLTNHARPEVRQRVAARHRRGAAILLVTDEVFDGLPDNVRTHLLTADGQLL